MANVAKYKKIIVDDLTKLMADYPVIAVVSVESVPAPQLQKVREQIRDNVVMKMTKRRLINIALDKAEESKKGIAKLKDYLGGMPSLMFTKENPFKLSAMLIKSKSKAPAKAGQTAPNDIVVEAGPTSFAPGPVIGELGQLGIKTKVENGKIAIKENKVLVKKGEEISENAAAMLTRLGIEPMEIGLMPEAAYDDGMIYTRDILEVDEKEYINKLNIANSEAFNLAYEIKYPAKEVVELLIAKAFNEAKAVGIEFKIIDEGIIDSLLGIAEKEMLSLKESAGIEVKEKPKEEKAEEKKEVVEEKKAKEEVKEEPKEEVKEKPKEEAKKEEKPKKEVKEKIKERKEEKTEEKKDKVDRKIEEMVKKTKDFVEGNIPSAENLVDEAKEKPKEEKAEEKKEAVEEKKPEQDKVEEKTKEEVKMEKNTQSTQNPAKETAILDAKKKKDEKEMHDVQEIVKKLQRGEKL